MAGTDHKLFVNFLNDAEEKLYGYILGWFKQQSEISFKLSEIIIQLHFVLRLLTTNS